MAGINEITQGRQFQNQGRTQKAEGNFGIRGKALLKRFLIYRVSDPPEKAISFWVNPSECQWRVGTRTVIEKIQGGAIHHEWPRSNSNTNLDEPMLSLTFQSGSILPEGYREEDSGANDSVPMGLGNFYDFLDLLGRSGIIPDGQPGAGGPNFVVIQYHSNIFPDIMLLGFFAEDGVQWTDSSDSPNQITSWGASFMVFDSEPAIHDAQALISTYSEVLSIPRG